MSLTSHLDSGQGGIVRDGIGSLGSLLLMCLRILEPFLGQTKVSVLGQNEKVLEYKPDADPTSRFKQTEAGLKLSVMRAQRIYNNKARPNTVVLKLENVEFIENTKE